MKKIFTSLLVFVLVLSLVACGGKNELIGTWKVEDNQELESMGLDLRITFTEDTMEMMGMSFDYEIKGKILVLNMNGQEEKIEFEVNGDELTLIADGERQVLIRVKE